MKIKTASKINLALDVVGRLGNGYHEIESVFQTVGIYDEISVNLTDDGIISLTCEVPEIFSDSDPIPQDERNIAYKSARKFFNDHNLDCGCRIHIKKGIPSQAGMGGGSADSAGVLYCLSKLTGKEIISPEKLGADVPFFLTGGTAYVSGIGEKITPIDDFSGCFVIAKGREGVSTAEAYGKIDNLVNPVHPPVNKLVEAVKNSPENAHKYFGNLFEDAVQLDEVNKIKSVMLEYNALSPTMTGSGSAVFGLMPTMPMAESCASDLSRLGFYAEICQAVNTSFIEKE